MTFKKYEGFVVDEFATKDQVMADAKLVLETIQAQETDSSVGWYINIVHPKRNYCSVVISDVLRSVFPTLAKNIDLYDEDEFLNDLELINARVDILNVKIISKITSYVQNTPPVNPNVFDKWLDTSTSISTEYRCIDFANQIFEWIEV